MNPIETGTYTEQDLVKSFLCNASAMRVRAYVLKLPARSNFDKCGRYVVRPVNCVVEDSPYYDSYLNDGKAKAELIALALNKMELQVSIEQINQSLAAPPERTTT